ncbi:hypothetical protein [Sphingorhabdus sp.]|uniref:hypothetical protein n=1 Tax=Sphingorhabdus sp. TaxID=1902408 RepID=UPI003593ED20
MLDWIFDTGNTASVGALSFLIGIFGTGLTLVGLFYTFREARRAVSAADHAQIAVENFKLRVTQHDAGRDVAEASYALDITRRHLNNGSWNDASDSYEDARRAIIRMTMSIPSLPDVQKEKLRKMAEQIQRLCNKIDAAQSGKGEYPDVAKAKTVIRSNYEVLAAIKKYIEEANPYV